MFSSIAERTIYLSNNKVDEAFRLPSAYYFDTDDYVVPGEQETESQESAVDSTEEKASAQAPVRDNRGFKDFEVFTKTLKKVPEGFKLLVVAVDNKTVDSVTERIAQVFRQQGGEIWVDENKSVEKKPL